MKVGTPVGQLMLTVVALMFAACAAPKPGFFAERGLLGPEHPYLVEYADPTTKSLLGPDWDLDNYQHNKEGQPIKLKAADAYTSEYAIDTNDDGVYEKKVKLPRYELLFKHRKTDGVIWFQLQPLSRKDEDKELAVLLKRYVEAASGSETVSVTLRDKDVPSAGATTAAVSQSFATRIVDSQEATLADVPALLATFEVANVDQLKLSNDALWKRRRVLLLKPGFVHALDTKKDAKQNLQMLMTVGYANSPEYFDAGLPDYERLLDAIHILSDEAMMEVLRGALLDCRGTKEAQPFPVKVEVNPSGHAALPFGVGNTQLRSCLTKVFDSVRFLPREKATELEFQLTEATPLVEIPERTYEGPRGVASSSAPAEDEATAEAAEAPKEAAEESAEGEGAPEEEKDSAETEGADDAPSDGDGVNRVK